jgi:hypothetical protein
MRKKLVPSIAVALLAAILVFPTTFAISAEAMTVRSVGPAAAVEAPGVSPLEFVALLLIFIIAVLLGAITAIELAAMGRNSAIAPAAPATVIASRLAKLAVPVEGTEMRRPSAAEAAPNASITRPDVVMATPPEDESDPIPLNIRLV